MINMEEKEVKKEETMSAKGGTILILTAFVIGSIMGAASNNRKISEAYNRGVVDTLNKLLLNNK